MGKILLTIFEILAVYFILRTIVRAWRRSNIKEKQTQAKEFQTEYKEVLEFEEDHRGLTKKIDKVKEFKNKDLGGRK